jgi:hypothetical protein
MAIDLRPLGDDDLELIELARRTIDAHTDATAEEPDGVHTMGAAVRAADGQSTRA